MFGLGWTEVIVVIVVALLIFGPKKIPEIGSVFGKTLREFKDSINASDDEYSNDKSWVLPLNNEHQLS